MKKTSFLSGLILVLGLFGGTLQDDPPTTAAPAATEGASTPAESAAPTNDAQSGKETEGSPSAAAGGGKCKSDEVLSDTGCIPRGDFMNRVMMESWNDEGFQKVKELTSVVDSTRCKPYEVKTPNGCAPPKGRMRSYKVPILNSHLNSQKEVVNSRSNLRLHDDVPSDNDADDQPTRRKIWLGPPVSGQHRPRKYVFLPGRRLRMDKKGRRGRECRPYEVRGMKGRCIRRRRPKSTPRANSTEV